jgi:DNA-binding transcriptional MocR family regulator
MSHKFIRGHSAATIAGSIEQAVHGGALRPDGLLPPIRDLAATLKVSPVTVSAAYKRLQARGLLVSDGRRGTRVRSQPPSPVAHTALRRVPVDLVDLANGNPDPALLPPLELALRSLDATQPLYGAPQQVQALATFAAAELEADGIPAAHLTVTHGALDAIERVLREHLRPGDRVAVEDPTAPALLDLLKASAYALEPLAMDDDGVTSASLEAALARRLRAVVLTPRAQNPSGASLTRERAADLKRLLRRHRDVLVIENDAAGPIAGASPRTVCDGTMQWAVVRSTSAWLGPDLRVALLAGDEMTVARVRGRQALGSRWVSHLLQQLTLALWSDPSNGRRLVHASEVYAMRRRTLVTALAQQGIVTTGKDGFNVWIPVPEEAAVVQRLAERGWAVAAGERFRLRSAPGIRVTTAALAPEAARRIAANLGEILRL